MHFLLPILVANSLHETRPECFYFYFLEWILFFFSFLVFKHAGLDEVRAVGKITGGGLRVVFGGPYTKTKTKRQPESSAWGAKCSCPANEILKQAIMSL